MSVIDQKRQAWHIQSQVEDTQKQVARVADDSIWGLLVDNLNDNLELFGHERLLDVGSGIGVFPFQMKKHGWEIYGVEPDARTAKHLTDNVGICVYDNVASIEMDKNNYFDLITFNKVLEHVENPALILSSCLKFLKKNGFIYIELPDALASNDGSEREEFFIEHYHVFSPSSVNMLCERAGLKVIKQITFP